MDGLFNLNHSLIVQRNVLSFFLIQFNHTNIKSQLIEHLQNVLTDKNYDISLTLQKYIESPLIAKEDNNYIIKHLEKEKIRLKQRVAAFSPKFNLNGSILKLIWDKI